MNLRTYRDYDCTEYSDIDYGDCNGEITRFYTESADTKYEINPEKLFRIYDFVNNQYVLVDSYKITGWEISL